MAEVRRPLVLDTHIWIWAVIGDAQLRDSVRKTIADSLSYGVVFVPAICVGEVSMLWQKNRIHVLQPIHKWVVEALDKPGFVLAPLTPEIAIDAALLPGKFHKDPADCMIVATARVQNGVLITHDQEIIGYSQRGHVNVLPA